MNRKYSKELPSHTKTLYVASECQPRVKAGLPFAIDVLQQAAGLIKSNDSPAETSQINFFVDGPHERLQELDVVGRYPGPGSETTPDEYLPHIALMRRTLPWERNGVEVNKPWMILLTVAQSEIRTPGNKPIETRTVKSLGDTGKPDHDKDAHDQLLQAGYQPDTALDFVWLAQSLLEKILPLKSEIGQLCHLQRMEFDREISLDDVDSMWKLDDDCDVAVVVGNRLPYAGDAGEEPEKHYAFLVSIEKRTDLPWPAAHPAGADGEWDAPSPAVSPVVTPRSGSASLSAAAVHPGVIESVAGAGIVAVPLKKRPLVVLSHWSFTPSKGRDFEQVVKDLPFLPNGGVLRFGKLPFKGGSIPTMTADGYLVLDGPGTDEVKYRGPLTPVPVTHNTGIALRPDPLELAGGGKDYSYAAAFEVGRLLALADDGILEDLQQVRARVVIPEITKEWAAIDPIPEAIAWKDWVVNPAPEHIMNPTADPTGIAKAFTAEYGRPSKQQVLAQLDLNPAIEPGIGVIDIDDVTVGELEHMFSRVLTNGRS